MLTFKNYNVADWFSFYRIASVPLLLVLLWLGEKEFFSWFLLISYATDAIDGYLARKLKISSALGAQLDSMGDQLTFIMGLIGLWIFENAFIRTNLLIIAIAFVPYIVQMLIAFKKYGKATAFHTYLAKHSAVVQAAFILWTLFFGPEYWLFYPMIVIGIIETLEEITLIFMYDNWIEDVKGIYWSLKDERRKKQSPKF
jgi:CDP-diacylglycerol--glycerol-3-phosphate 3-phosphatidyltransferase